MTTNGNDQLTQVHKMLTALLKSENRIHWIGGYVYGRTSNDDPYILLYPSAEYLQEKVVRVYEHDFRKLPAFIPTDSIPGDTEANPNKGQAQKKRIYHECPVFQILTYDGKDTQMGKEKRFSDVLMVPTQKAEATGPTAIPSKPTQPATRPTPTAASLAQPNAKQGNGRVVVAVPSEPPQPPPFEDDELFSHTSATANGRSVAQPHLITPPTPPALPPAPKVDLVTARQRALMADFDTFDAWALEYLLLMGATIYTDADRVQSIREIIAPTWNPAKRGQLLDALCKYATKRQQMEENRFPSAVAHKEARTEAMGIYNRQINNNSNQ